MEVRTLFINCFVDCLLILQAVKSSIFSRILNLEWAIRPPGKKGVATPDDVVASAIIFLDRIVAKIARYRYVFPLPLELSVKKAPG